jgi:hypothetical protein
MNSNENDTAERPDALEKSDATACPVERLVMCDHIIGHNGAWEDGAFVYASELAKYFEDHPMSKELQDAYIQNNIDQFSFCPICGDRVNDTCDFDGT